MQTPYAGDTFKQTRRRLEQLVAVRACGLLHGPMTVGKTLLVQHFLKSLPDKRYKPLVLCHSSVSLRDYRDNLGPLLLNYHDNLLLKYREPEHHFVRDYPCVQWVKLRRQNTAAWSATRL